MASHPDVARRSMLRQMFASYRYNGVKPVGADSAQWLAWVDWKRAWETTILREIKLTEHLPRREKVEP